MHFSLSHYSLKSLRMHVDVVSRGVGEKMVYISQQGSATLPSGSSVCFYSMPSLLVFSQTRVETQPNIAQCVHFIRNDALHISILIPCTSCCRPQAAYGAEYAVMDNKPQSEPKSVIFQPCQTLKSSTQKLTSGFQTRKLQKILVWEWDTAVMRDRLVNPWTLSESRLHSDSVV